MTKEAALCLWWRCGQSMRIGNCSDTPGTLPKPEKHKHRSTKLRKNTNTPREKHRDSNYTQVAMWSVSEELELAAPPTYFALRLFIIHCFTPGQWPQDNNTLQCIYLEIQCYYWGRNLTIFSNKVRLRWAKLSHSWDCCY